MFRRLSNRFASSVRLYEIYRAFSIRFLRKGLFCGINQYMDKILLPQRKLQEAEFFLGATDHFFHNNLPQYDFYLNAFIMSVKSITEIIQSENSKNKIFKQWWEKKHKDLLDEKGLYYKFHHLRIISFHRKILKPSKQKIEITFDSGLSISESVEIPVNPNYSGPVFVQGIKQGQQKRYLVIEEINIDNGKKYQIYFDDFITESRDYMIFLKNLFEELKLLSRPFAEKT